MGNITWDPSPPLLWLARYAPQPGPMPLGFFNWWIWQYKEDAHIDGISGPVDADQMQSSHTATASYNAKLIKAVKSNL